VFCAGFPSSVEKSAVGLFHGASFPQPLRRPFRFSYCALPVIRIYGLSSVGSLVVQRQSFCSRGWNRAFVSSVLRVHLNDQVTPYDIAICPSDLR